jgi:hypothetical protein
MGRISKILRFSCSPINAPRPVTEALRTSTIGNSVDVTGERNIATQIAFGVSDRRAQDLYRLVRQGRGRRLPLAGHRPGSATGHRTRGHPLRGPPLQVPLATCGPRPPRLRPPAADGAPPRLMTMLPKEQGGELASGCAGLKCRPVHRKLRSVNRRHRGAGDGAMLPVLPSGPDENRLRFNRRAILPLTRLGAVGVVFSRSADC